jgi:heme/copper-type cytochrome/quinol oxidase subunit 3
MVIDFQDLLFLRVSGRLQEKPNGAAKKRQESLPYALTLTLILSSQIFILATNTQARRNIQTTSPSSSSYSLTFLITYRVHVKGKFVTLPVATFPLYSLC